MSKTIDEIRALHSAKAETMSTSAGSDIQVDISPPHYAHPPKFPVQVGWGQNIKYNPEGNKQHPLLAIAYSDVTSNGMIELLILPPTGGEVVRKYSVPHDSLFPTITNKNLRKNGSWSAM